jgi:TatD DNase family protein
MSPFIDIHTHQTIYPSDNLIAIQNRLLHENNITTGKQISVGWHPWNLNDYSPEEMKTILYLESLQKNVIAIGECGLDRSCKTDFRLQLKIFREHIVVANKSSKPLIIHCVRAYSDLLEILKNENYHGNMILHDYRGNLQQTKELQTFNCWFSFGKSIINPIDKLRSVFQSIPLSRIFLETDNTNHSIEEIYQQASKIRSIDIEEFKQKIEENFHYCFGNSSD